MTVGLFVPAGTQTPGGGWRFVPPSPQVVSVQQPAAGHGLTYKLPSGYLCRLSSVSATLVTSAAAAGRNAFLAALAPTGATLWRVYVGQAANAGSTLAFSFVRGAPLTKETGSASSQIMPDVTLPPNCTLDIVVGTIQAGDQLSAITIVYELY